MPLYTGTGDQGWTSLFGGSRIEKCDARFSAVGDVDELNAVLGMALTLDLQQKCRDIVLSLQHDLFALGARLSDPESRIAARVKKATILEGDVERLEGWIDVLDAALPDLNSFILPGGGQGGSVLHFARTLCRRAERKIVGLGIDTVDPIILRYINRLSDLLFVLARTVNFHEQVREVEW
mgnify:CR=1 FL=1